MAQFGGPMSKGRSKQGSSGRDRGGLGCVMDVMEMVCGVGGRTAD